MSRLITTSRNASLVILLLALLPPQSPAEERRVDLVVGANAPRLESYAAQEMAGQLKRLFNAQVSISAQIPEFSGKPDSVGEPRN